MNDIAQEIEDEFAFLGDWEERYRHVIELGKAMPTLAEHQKIEANKINGCVSQVWLTFQQDEAGRFSFSGDSDAHIVRGLVALLLRLVDGKTPSEILATQATELFANIGLSDNLSAQRANGLQAMIGRIRQLAQAAL
ncbi:MAG: cysteine desulfuration protein SufE [Robiginitomaculum sp.]|nr:MAG: cysteine desulfuration protein SufE [Robiginitomaculum sp.]